MAVNQKLLNSQMLKYNIGSNVVNKISGEKASTNNQTNNNQTETYTVKSTKFPTYDLREMIGPKNIGNLMNYAYNTVQYNKLQQEAQNNTDPNVEYQIQGPQLVKKDNWKELQTVATYNNMENAQYNKNQKFINLLNTTQNAVSNGSTVEDLKQQFPEYANSDIIDNLYADVQKNQQYNKGWTNSNFLQQYSNYYSDLLQAGENDINPNANVADTELIDHLTSLNLSDTKYNALSDGGKNLYDFATLVKSYADAIRNQYYVQGNPSDWELVKQWGLSDPDGFNQVFGDIINNATTLNLGDEARLKLNGIKIGELATNIDDWLTDARNFIQNQIASDKAYQTNENGEYINNGVLDRVYRAGSTAINMGVSGVTNLVQGGSSLISDEGAKLLVDIANKKGANIDKETANERLRTSKYSDLENLIQAGMGAFDISIFRNPIASAFVGAMSEIKPVAKGFEWVGEVVNDVLSQTPKIKNIYNELDPERQEQATQLIAGLMTVGILKSLGESKPVRYVKGLTKDVESAVRSGLKGAKEEANFQRNVIETGMGKRREVLNPDTGEMTTEFEGYSKGANKRVLDSAIGGFKEGFRESRENRNVNQGNRLEYNPAATEETKPEATEVKTENAGNVVQGVSKEVGKVVKGVSDAANTVSEYSKSAIDTINTTVKNGLNAVKNAIKENIIEPYKEGRGTINQRKSTQDIFKGQQEQSTSGLGEINQSNNIKAKGEVNSKPLNTVQTQMIQNYNRMNPKAIDKFEERYGQNYGQWLADRGFTQAGEANLDSLVRYKSNLMDLKEDALNQIEGRFRDESVKDMLDHVVEYATDVKSPDKNRFVELSNTYDREGLLMSEINEIRRRFSYHIRTGFFKDGNSKGVELANNEYMAVKKYLDKIAKENGLDSLDELNREISATEHLIGGITYKLNGQGGNNVLGLNDYITLGSVISNPEARPVAVTKLALKNPKVRNKILDIVVGRKGNAKNRITRESLNDELNRIDQINDAKKKAKAMQEFADKYLKPSDLQALTFNEGANDLGGGTIDVSPITTTPEGQSVRKGQIQEIDKREQKSQGLSQLGKKSEAGDNKAGQVQAKKKNDQNKIVDKNGKPKNVYHYSDTDFDTFDFGKMRNKLGAYFSPSSKPTSKLRKYKITANIDMKNPLTISPTNKSSQIYPELKPLWSDDDAFDTKFRELLKRDGYDGVIMLDDKGNVTQYVVLDPDQITVKKKQSLQPESEGLAKINESKENQKKEGLAKVNKEEKRLGNESDYTKDEVLYDQDGDVDGKISKGNKSITYNIEGDTGNTFIDGRSISDFIGKEEGLLGLVAKLEESMKERGLNDLYVEIDMEDHYPDGNVLGEYDTDGVKLADKNKEPEDRAIIENDPRWKHFVNEMEELGFELESDNIGYKRFYKNTDGSFLILDEHAGEQPLFDMDKYKEEWAQDSYYRNQSKNLDRRQIDQDVIKAMENEDIETDFRNGVKNQIEAEKQGLADINEAKKETKAGGLANISKDVEEQAKLARGYYKEETKGMKKPEKIEKLKDMINVYEAIMKRLEGSKNSGPTIEKMQMQVDEFNNILSELSGTRMQRGSGSNVSKKEIRDLVKQLKKTGLAKDVKMYNTQQEFLDEIYGSENQAKFQLADETVYTVQPLERIEEMEQTILDEYGTTENPYRVAFIDNKGRWINGNMGGYGNYRDVDHREIAQTAFDDTDIEFETGTDGLVALQAQTGLVRVNYNDGYLNIDTVYGLMPSQRSGLMDFAKEDINQVYVDITDPKTGRTIESKTFDNVRDAVMYIDNHFSNIQYLKDTHGDIAGAVTPDGTVHLIESNLRGDTPTHEFSHLLRNYAKENSPELFNAINKIAKEAPQELKDYVKRTYGDLSDDAFLDEVFAWRQGKYSGIKGARSWYQKMRDAIKRIWNNIKNKFGKKYADLNVFEAYEKMNSEELMSKVDNLLKGGKEIGRGEGATQFEVAGNIYSNNFKNWFGDWENGGKDVSKVVDYHGNPKIVYHGSPSGEFYVFDKSKASGECDWGAGFYFTDSDYDVRANYAGGGPDFDNKVTRLAEQYEQDLEIPYEEAAKKAYNELHKGEYEIEAYLNMKNPVYVGEDATDIVAEWFEKSVEEYNMDDFDNEDDYWYAVDEARYEAVDDIYRKLYQLDISYGFDEARDKVAEFFTTRDSGTAQELKDFLNDGSIEVSDENGNFINNEVARAVLEGLGYDGIIDSSVSTKFKNMNLSSDTTHYIVFEPTQIKSATDNVGTYDPNNPDIRYEKIGGLDNTQIKKFAVQQGLAEISKPQTKEYTVDKGKVKENF